MPANADVNDLARQAKFIFRGTVKKLEATTLRALAPSKNAIVVRVDEIMRAPAALGGHAGKEITVVLSERRKLKVGEQAVFYTNGWLFGESVAVQSLGHHSVGKISASLKTESIDPVKSLKQRELQEHFDQADLVVSGKVTGVRLLETSPSGLRPREHDPHWQEAVVEIGGVHKGSHDQQTVVVRFPGSDDVAWHRAPKLRPGLEGFFVLHRSAPAIGGAGGALIPEAGAPGFYTILHPEDFQSIHQPEGIHKLIKAL